MSLQTVGSRQRRFADGIGPVRIGAVFDKDAGVDGTPTIASPPSETSQYQMRSDHAIPGLR
jgi:hypothetical protein